MFWNRPQGSGEIPDPKRSISWGDQSCEEMHIGFTEVAFDAKIDADKILAVEKKVAAR